ncbi:MAG: hypothetical protein KOO62_12555, partial [candidate division Zixibacteria bacterium]|nr:hypothetical protein [candidate division Zixibacteria bacterium]
MRNLNWIMGLIALSFVLGVSVQAQIGRRVILDRADEFEAIHQGGEWVSCVNGDVVFITETGRIYCDSARFLTGRYVDLKGSVLVDDADYLLRADSVYYNIATGHATAWGEHVELWSYADSLYGVGVHAFYDNEAGFFEMEDRPIIYLKYPDTARMVEIIADFVHYQSDQRYAEASGNVIITSHDFSAEGPCAVMLIEEDILDLYDNPVARRRESEITGDFISVVFQGDVLSRIDVIDSAFGEFSEPIDSAGIYHDRSILSGERITLNFVDNDLDNVLCYGQAYSWYFPSLRGGREYNENSVSGDTIYFRLVDNRLQSVTVVDGVVGTYVSGTLRSAADYALDDTSFTELILDSLAALKAEESAVIDSLSDLSAVGDTVVVPPMITGPAIDSGAGTIEATTDSTDSTTIPLFVSPADTLDLKFVDSIEY